MHMVGNALLILFGEKDKSKLTWENAQKMMTPPAEFMNKLHEFGFDEMVSLPATVIADLEPILSLDFFNRQFFM